MPIDVKEFESYAEARSKSRWFIPREKLITLDEVTELFKLYKNSNLKAAELDKCYEPSKTLNDKFIVEVICMGQSEVKRGRRVKQEEKEGCCAHLTIKMSKTSLAKYLKDGDYTCDECLKIEKKEREDKWKERDLHNEKQMEENTKNYIENYLDPERSWEESCHQKDRWNHIARAYVDYEKVRQHGKSMDYYEFLKTPYWKAVSQYKKYKAGFKCNLCNDKEHLQTHHRTYTIRGMEHAKLEDLIVLCHDCHAKFHDN